MAKLGRYSADRKKLEDITAAKTVQVSDCGTIFTISTSAAIDINLPAAASAGNGWWCRFVYKAGSSSNDATIKVNTADADKFHARISSNGLSGSAASANDGIKFDVSACAVGDYVEVYTDSTNWYAMGMASGSAALLAFNA